MATDPFSLPDQVAIVTAGGRGIGAATAVALATAGSHVVVSARSGDQLEEVVAAVAALGNGTEALAVESDLAVPGALSQLVDAASERFGRLDTVVNNLGGTMPRPFVDVDRAGFEQALSFNAGTAYELTRAAVRLLVASPNASVVNISSVAGLQAMQSMTAYGTAKAAMNALTRNLAQELAPKVRVNAIAPGFIETSATEIVAASDELRDMVVDATPMRRLGHPDDIAHAVQYLASPAASFVTGVIIPVHGGAEKPTLEMPTPPL
jgi:7-alpha-hydroxysteroid dehydrogenase